ncbi:hypothetical protein [Vibrio splendidus]|uniref:hypothetical protein n=1 Tax=Vibrio splendidus TaxID=29497 RepID=UPI000D3845A2|nr:hypothetical protein [Vibrio splendidus]PTO77591.1 hypothetical protein CWN84_10355 [Vibrio splendidus]
MLNIEQIATNAVKNTLASAELQEAIEKKIEETITSELTDFFRSYSDFGKAFKGALKDQLKLDMDNLGILEYNHFITTTIRERFNKHIEGPVVNQVDTLLNEICPTAGETVQFDDLITMLKDGITDYQPDHSGSFAVCFKREDRSWNSSYISIGFDEDSATSSYLSTGDKSFNECRNTIQVDIKTRKVIGFNIGYQGNDSKAKVTTFKRDFESHLFRMYATGSVIDFGDIHDQFMELGEGDEVTAYDMDIETEYDWAND